MRRLAIVLALCLATPAAGQQTLTLGPVSLTLPNGRWQVAQGATRLVATQDLGEGRQLRFRLMQMPLNAAERQGTTEATLDARLADIERRLTALSAGPVYFEGFRWQPAGLRCRYHQGIATTRSDMFLRQVGSICRMPGPQGGLLEADLTYVGPQTSEEYRFLNDEFEIAFEGITVKQP